MKIEFEEKELKYIDNINKDLQDGFTPTIFLSQKDRQYYLTITVKDIAKANAFLMGLIRNPQFNSEELEEKFGLTIDSINYCEGDEKARKLKSLLQQFMNELDNL